MGLFGLHDGKRFAEVSTCSEIFVSLMREFHEEGGQRGEGR